MTNSGSDSVLSLKNTCRSSPLRFVKIFCGAIPVFSSTNSIQIPLSGRARVVTFSLPLPFVILTKNVFAIPSEL